MTKEDVQETVEAPVEVKEEVPEEAPAEEVVETPAEEVPEETPEETVEEDLHIRHAVIYGSLHFSLGDGVAEQLARDPKSVKKVWVPVLSKEVETKELVWADDNKPVNK